MHKEEVKARLRMRYGTLIAFERARSLPARSVKDVLRGRSVRRTAEAIADELGMALHDLFPHLRSSTSGDDTAEISAPHRLNAKGR